MSAGEHRLGRYRLIDQLAIGGMAELYRAEMLGPSGFRKTVVIKKILPYLAKNEEFRRMFLHEGRVMATLTHRNLIPVFDMGAADGELYICMEYIDGPSLYTIMQNCKNNNTQLDVSHSLWIGHEVCRGLDYAHSYTDEEGHEMRVVHRDVKPQNILISKQGDIKLGDFGIAMSTKKKSRTKHGHVKGSLPYLSPEQARGDTVGPASDQYAVGLILYELLSGTSYNQATEEADMLHESAHPSWRPLTSKVQTISPRLEKCIRRTLAPEPENRYASTAILADELNDILLQDYQIPTSYDIAELVCNLDSANMAKAIPAPPPKSASIESLLEESETDETHLVDMGAAVKYKTEQVESLYAEELSDETNLTDISSDSTHQVEALYKSSETAETFMIGMDDAPIEQTGPVDLLQMQPQHHHPEEVIPYQHQVTRFTQIQMGRHFSKIVVFIITCIISILILYFGFRTNPEAAHSGSKNRKSTQKARENYVSLPSQESLGHLKSKNSKRSNLDLFNRRSPKDEKKFQDRSRNSAKNDQDNAYRNKPNSGRNITAKAIKRERAKNKRATGEKKNTKKKRVGKRRGHKKTPARHRAETKKQQTASLGPEQSLPKNTKAMATGQSKTAEGPTRRELNREYKRIKQKIKNRGIRNHDIPDLDTQLASAFEEIKNDRFNRAQQLLSSIEQNLGIISIDRQFVERKIRRLQNRLERTGRKNHFRETIDKVIDHTLNNRFEDANRNINQILDALE